MNLATSGDEQLPKGGLNRVRIQNISRPTTTDYSPSKVISNKYFSTSHVSQLPVHKALRSKTGQVSSSATPLVKSQQPLIFHTNRCHLQHGHFTANGHEPATIKENDLSELLNASQHSQLKTSASLSLPSNGSGNLTAAEVLIKHQNQQTTSSTPKAKNLTNLRDILKASHSANNVAGVKVLPSPIGQKTAQQNARSMSTKIPSASSNRNHLEEEYKEKPLPLPLSSSLSDSKKKIKACEQGQIHRWSETSLEDILKFSETEASSSSPSNSCESSASSPVDSVGREMSDESPAPGSKGEPQAILSQIEKDLKESFSMLTKFKPSATQKEPRPAVQLTENYAEPVVKFRRNSVDRNETNVAQKRLNDQINSDRSQLANLSEMSEMTKTVQDLGQLEAAFLARSSSDKLTQIDERKCLKDYDIKDSDLKELHEKFIKRIQGLNEGKGIAYKPKKPGKAKKNVHIDPCSLNKEYEFDPETIDLCKPSVKAEPEDNLASSSLVKSTPPEEDMRSPLNEMCIRIRASLANDLKNQSSSTPQSSTTWNYDELNELRMKFISLLSSSSKTSETSPNSSSSPSDQEQLSINTNDKSLIINTRNLKSDQSDSSLSTASKPSLNRSSMSFVSYSPQTIRPAEQLVIESFYRSFGTNLFISESCASLFTMPFVKLTPIDENQATFSSSNTQTRIVFSNQTSALDTRTLQRNTLRRDEEISPNLIRDFLNQKFDKYVSVYHRGIPLWLFNSGVNPRRPYRQLKFTLAEKGTGFILWQDRIDSRSDFKIHLLRKSDQKIVGYASYCEMKLEKMKEMNKNSKNNFDHDMAGFKELLDDLSEQYSSMLISFKASDRKTAVLIKFDINDESVKFYEHYMQIIEKLNLEIKQRTKSLPIGVGINQASILSGLSTGLSVAHSAKQNNRNSLMSRIRFIPSTNTKDHLSDFEGPQNSATMSGRHSGLFSRRQSVYSTTSNGTGAPKSKKINKSNISQPCGLKHIIKIKQDDRDSFYTLSKLLPASSSSASASSSPSSIGPLTTSSVKLSSNSPTSCVNKATPSPTASITSSSSVSASSDNSSSLVMSNKNDSLVDDYDKRCSSSIASTKAQSPFSMAPEARSSVSNSSSCSSSSSLSISPSSSIQQQPIATLTTAPVSNTTVFRRNITNLDKYKTRESVRTTQVNASTQREIMELTRKSMR